jgi:hypothetical protein
MNIIDHYMNLPISKSKKGSITQASIDNSILDQNFLYPQIESKQRSIVSGGEELMVKNSSGLIHSNSLSKINIHNLQNSKMIERVKKVDLNSSVQLYGPKQSYDEDMVYFQLNNSAQPT